MKKIIPIFLLLLLLPSLVGASTTRNFMANADFLNRYYLENVTHAYINDYFYVDVNTLFVNDTLNRVCLGTTNCLAAFHNVGESLFEDKVNITQQTEDRALLIDSNAANAIAFTLTGNNSAYIEQDIVGGYGLRVKRDVGSTETQPLVEFWSDDNQPVLSLRQDTGTSPHITTSYTNDDLRIDPNGIGKTIIFGDINITENAYVMGNATVYGTATFLGGMILGGNVNGMGYNATNFSWIFANTLNITDVKTTTLTATGLITGTNIVLTGNISAVGTGAQNFEFGGGTTDASNIYTFAAGYNARAIGQNSIAIGEDVTVSNDNGVAIGDSVIVQGVRAVGLGYNVNATSTNSFALGQNIGVGGASMGIGLGSTPGLYQVTQANILAILGGKVAIGSTSAVKDLDVVGVINATQGILGGATINGTTGYYTNLNASNNINATNGGLTVLDVSGKTTLDSDVDMNFAGAENLKITLTDNGIGSDSLILINRPKVSSNNAFTGMYIYAQTGDINTSGNVNGFLYEFSNAGTGDVNVNRGDIAGPGDLTGYYIREVATGAATGELTALFASLRPATTNSNTYGLYIEHESWDTVTGTDAIHVRRKQWDNILYSPNFKITGPGNIWQNSDETTGTVNDLSGLTLTSGSLLGLTIDPTVMTNIGSIINVSTRYYNGTDYIYSNLYRMDKFGNINSYNWTNSTYFNGTYYGDISHATGLPIYNSSYEWYNNATIFLTANATYDAIYAGNASLWLEAQNKFNSTYDLKPSNTFNSTYNAIYEGNTSLWTEAQNKFNSSYNALIGLNNNWNGTADNNLTMNLNTIFGGTGATNYLLLKASTADTWNTNLINITGGSTGIIDLRAGSSGNIYLRTGTSDLALINLTAFFMYKDLDFSDISHSIKFKDNTDLALAFKDQNNVEYFRFSSIDGTEKNVFSKNIDATGYNVTAAYFKGDGSLLTGLSSGGNSSWNESYANTKYANTTHTQLTYSTLPFTVSAILGTGTKYLAPGQSSSINDILGYIASRNETINNMYIVLGTAPGGTDTVEFRPMIDGVVQAMTVLINGTEIRGNTTSNPINILTGQRFSINMTGTATTAANANIGVGISSTSSAP